MYSVVLLMAMSGAPDSAAVFCHKSHGCQGAVATSCGCSGTAMPVGCYGGGMGCYGGAACHGGAGCYGGAACHGGHGGLFHKHAHGCAGGCQGYVAASCGCCGTAMPVGCYGGMGGYVVPMGTAPAGGAPAAAPKMPATGGGTPPVAGGGLPLAYSPAPATLVVNLPDDANLKIDGVATKATAGSRQFTTPVLARGQNYYYTLSAEIVRDGKTYAATQTVTVRAGQTSQVEIPAGSFGMAVASK